MIAYSLRRTHYSASMVNWTIIYSIEISNTFQNARWAPNFDCWRRVDIRTSFGHRLISVCGTVLSNSKFRMVVDEDTNFDINIDFKRRSYGEWSP